MTNNHEAKTRWPLIIVCAALAIWTTAWCVWDVIPIPKRHPIPDRKAEIVKDIPFPKVPPIVGVPDLSDGEWKKIRDGRLQNDIPFPDTAPIIGVPDLSDGEWKKIRDGRLQNDIPFPDTAPIIGVPDLSDHRAFPRSGATRVESGSDSFISREISQTVQIVGTTSKRTRTQQPPTLPALASIRKGESVYEEGWFGGTSKLQLQPVHWV